MASPVIYAYLLRVIVISVSEISQRKGYRNNLFIYLVNKNGWVFAKEIYIFSE